MKTQKDYYIGLDIGTSSVGFAATDESYDLIKLCGKKVIGTRLFSEAETAQVRRQKRSARRRYERRTQRLNYLEEIFASEIEKIDKEFFLRLKESKYILDDKKVETKNILFNDKNYTDKEHYKKYPTIYHLRASLFSEENPDLRKIYLALHHILKHRGHFTFEGENFVSESSLENILLNLNDDLVLDFEEIIKDEEIVSEIAKILKDNNINKKEKEKRLNNYLQGNKQYKEFFKLAIGNKAKLDTLFDNEELKEDKEHATLSFSDAIFDDKRDSYVRVLGEDITLIDNAKKIYDAILLANIVEEGLTISESKIKKFNKHKKDKEILKNLIKNDKKLSKEEASSLYNTLFKEDKVGSYKYYVEKSDTEDKFLKSITNKLEDSEELTKIKKDIENGNFLPLQKVGSNSSIPYQLHKIELEKILKNAEKYHSFLLEKIDGKTISERIIKLFEFRIPYYIGPLNTYHKDKGGTAWSVKNKNCKVTPWNFDEVVNIEDSAENFIRKMTNKCTYLREEDVIPKNSILYSEFELLNELNTLNKNGVRLSVEVRNEIIEELFKKKVQKVTLKKIEKFLVSRNLLLDGEELRGADKDIKSTLRSYVELKEILQDEYTLEMAENIILWLTLFGDAKEIFKKKVTERYATLRADTIEKLSKLKYSGWGRLSRKLLTEIYAEQFFDEETGEMQNIIKAMRKNMLNFMELLSSKYSYYKEIEKYNHKNIEDISKLDYSILDDFYISPEVKRSVWQTLKIVEEITKISKIEPKKIFIEATRTNNATKQRTNTRKQSLENVYKNIKKEYGEIENQLKTRSEAVLRRKKMFLYFTQAGRCAYSGEVINIDNIDTSAYDIDHIYPRKLTKDDSIHNNLVLVKRELNDKKKADYPLSETLKISDNVKKHWKFLVGKGLITKEKYRRLTRVTKLTDDELSGFIERQLVSTSQGVKAVASILKMILPNTEIVYVKAENISEFRNKFANVRKKGENKSEVVYPELLKIRELNDHHHAHDAFLSIVVGSCFNTKFTNNAYNFIKNKEKSKNPKEYHYNLDKMYEKNIERNGYVAWDTKKTLKKVVKTLRYKWILVTKKLEEEKGAFYKETLYGKNEAKKEVHLPTKTSDPRLQDVTKYGGYTAVSIAYNTIVSYDKDKKKSSKKEDTQKNIRIIGIPVYLQNKLKNDEDLLKYLQKVVAEKYEGTNVKVIYKKLCKNSKIKINNHYYYMGGRSKEQFLVNTAVQFVLDLEYRPYLKNLLKYSSVIKDNPKTEPTDYKIDTDKNIKFYELLVSKMRENIYKERRIEKTEELDSKDKKELFNSLTTENQVKILLSMINLLRDKIDRSMFKNINMTISEQRFNSDLTKCKKIEIFEQSITGLKEKVVVIIG